MSVSWSSDYMPWDKKWDLVKGVSCTLTRNHSVLGAVCEQRVTPRNLYGILCLLKTPDLYFPTVDYDQSLIKAGLEVAYLSFEDKDSSYIRRDLFREEVGEAFDRASISTSHLYRSRSKDNVKKLVDLFGRAIKATQKDNNDHLDVLKDHKKFLETLVRNGSGLRVS